MSDSVTGSSQPPDFYLLSSTLIHSLPGAVYRCINDGRWSVEFMSQGCLELTGYPSTAFMSGSLSFLRQVILPEDRPYVTERAHASYSRGEPYRLVYRIRHAAGDIRWISDLGQGITNADGALLRLEGFMTDVTQTHEAIQELRQSEERLRLMAENAADAIYRLRFVPLHSYEYMSPAIQRLTGYTPADFYADSSLGYRILHPGDRAILATMPPAQEERHRQTYRIIRRDGRLVWTEHDVVPLHDDEGHVVGVDGIMRDITERMETQRALKRSERRFRQLLESTPDPMIILRESGAIVLANRAVLDLYGYRAEELQAANVRELLPPRLRGEHPDILTQRIASLHGQGGSLRYETITRHRNGTEIPIEVTLSEIPSDEGLLLAAGIRDISARRRSETALRRSEERFRLLAEQARDMIYRYELDPPRWDYVSPASIEVTGYAPEEFYADHRLGFRAIHPEDRHLVSDLGRAPETIPDPLILRWNRKDGATAWLEYHNTAIRDPRGRIVAVEGIVRDITAHHKLERQMLRVNQDLECRVRERTAQLEAANQELERFSSSVSHDLRAPLQAVEGFCRILLENFGEALPDESAPYLHRIRANGWKMNRIMDDLLAFSHTGRQPLSMTWVDMDALVLEALEDLADRREGRDVKLLLEPLGVRKGDRDLLHQVLANLLDNALKFSRDRDQAVIRVGVEDVEGEPAIFVEDNGVGFDMRYAAKLFGMFQRLHSERDFEGDGVGLALVQRIVHRHGGRVWAAGEAGRGARLSFTLGRAEGGIEDDPGASRSR